MIESNANLLIIDVRTPDEFKESHIEGAVNIPHDLIETQLDQVDLSKTLLVYCGVGSRSAYASGILSKHGYEVYNMYEGYKTYIGELK
ncbi:MAG: rhodanese-like domain-containing protein [Clostridiales bacterium]|nr:rhodanese-like domain-containing protein [Clostridiales bacterium]